MKQEREHLIAYFARLMREGDFTYRELRRMLCEAARIAKSK